MKDQVLSDTVKIQQQNISSLSDLVLKYLKKLISIRSSKYKN